MEAARALARGDGLRALGLVGNEESDRARLIRGIALAQLGDHEAARVSLDSAVRSRDEETRLRAQAALVDLALGQGRAAVAAKEAKRIAGLFSSTGDRRNAAMMTIVGARAEVLLGRPQEARGALESLTRTETEAEVLAAACLAEAEVAIAESRPSRSRAALDRARMHLAHVSHSLLGRAVEAAEHDLLRPVARIHRGGRELAASLFEVEALLDGPAFVIDACKKRVVSRLVEVPLSRRPVLFGLLLELGQSAPRPVSHGDLLSRVFGARRSDESHRVRLRVEIGRLRERLEGTAARIESEKGGYRLVADAEVVRLLPETDERDSRVYFLLGDGASWSARELAEHTASSVRSVQRALGDLVERGLIGRFGSGKQVRYARAPIPSSSRMLLAGLLPDAYRDPARTDRARTHEPGQKDGDSR
jgi:DNA-binding winged helix-turn-helix (wHTH) protein